MSVTIKTYIVDSFTDQPFSGNPAGVCLLRAAISDNTMLLIAKELGLSETAFVQPIANSVDYAIRFFSPVMEIPLCGHATLAAAKIIFDRFQVPSVKFVNIHDLVLFAKKVGEEIIMEFPIYETEPAEVNPELLTALGLSSVENVVYNKETNILMLEITNINELAELAPDYYALVKTHDSINGVLVTAPSHEDDYDFHSRYFWPWSGTNEDPVTGGTHTFLAKYWSIKLNKTRMRSFQASERSGFMQVELVDDKLLITGQAQIVLEGEFRL